MASLLGLFVEGLRCNSDGVAVRFCGDSKDDTKEVTYRDIDSDSTKIAQSLSNLDCQNEIIFSSCTTRISTVSVTLGILKVPAAFAYIDWKQPQIITGQFLEECGSRYMVVAKTELENVKKAAIEYRSLDVISCHGETLVVIEFVGVRSRKYDYHGWQLAYAIQTSGTTGKPKTVKVPHRCIVPNIDHLRELYLMTADDVVFVASPFTFDPSIVDVFLAFSVGATLLLLPDRLKMIAHQLISILASNVTMMQVTPSLMRRFGPDKLRKTLLGPESRLRILGLGGEQCPSVYTLRKWKHPCNATKIFNLYGITEVSSWATVHQVRLSDDHVDGAIPIGEPIRDTELQVLDEDGLMVDDGEGQLFVGGGERVCFIGWEGHAEGSAGPLRATGDVVRVLPGGRMLHIGRLDDQVKRNGKKVSLQQIETAALNLYGVRDGVAIYDLETGLLILAVTVEDGLRWSERKVDLRSRLLVTLPSHLVPDRIVVMSSLPVSPHGKIDKRIIVSRANRDDADTVKSMDSLTFDLIVDKLRVVWKVHMAAPFPQTDLADINFVAHGGDSLKAVRFAEDVNFWLGVDCPLLVELLLGGTLKDVCTYVESVVRVAAESRPCVVPSSQSGDGPVSHCPKRDVASRATFLQNFLTESRIAPNISWRFDTGKCVDASPLVLCSDGKRTVYIGSHSHIFAAIDLDTGLLRWSFVTGDRIESSASSSSCGQYVYFGCYDHYVYCLTSETGALRWKFQTDGILKCSPTFDVGNDCIYFGSYDHLIYSVGSKSGDLRWKAEIDGGSIFSSPTIASSPHQVYFATLGGTFTARNPDSGKVIWKVTLGMPLFSSPTLVPDGVCVGCVDSNLYCFDHSGGLRWTYKTDGPIFSSPCLFRVHPDAAITKQPPRLVVGSHDQFLHCVDVDSGEECWKVHFDSPVYSSPFVYGDTVYSCSTNGTLRVMSAESGEVCSEQTFAGETFSSVVAYDGKLVFGCRDNFVYCLDLIVKHDYDTTVHSNPN